MTDGVKGTQGTSQGQRSLAGKYLTFELGSAMYGFELLSVREIIRMINITPVPGTNEYIRGIINLRGKIIPVVDIKKKFGLAEGADSEQTCIVVVDVGGVQSGAVVDRVAQVASFAEGEVEPPPALGEGSDTGHILGIGKTGDKVTMLIDTTRMLDKRELSEIAKIAA